MSNLGASDRRQAGFTLVELLVAMVVSAIMLGAIFSAVSVASGRTQAARLQSDALSVARARIEAFVAGPFSEQTSEGTDAGLRWQMTERAIMRDQRGLVVLSEARVGILGKDGRPLLTLKRRALKFAAPL